MVAGSEQMQARAQPLPALPRRNAGAVFARITQRLSERYGVSIIMSIANFMGYSWGVLSAVCLYPTKSLRNFVGTPNIPQTSVIIAARNEGRGWVFHSNV